MATYLIDYENVYIEGLTGLEYLTKRDEVVIFYTQNRCGLTFELHQRLISCDAKLRLMEVTALSTRKNTVKNALDLQLSMYIGYLIGSRPKERLHIISKDTDFDLNQQFYDRYLQEDVHALSIYSTIENAMKGIPTRDAVHCCGCTCGYDFNRRRKRTGGTEKGKEQCGNAVPERVTVGSAGTAGHRRQAGGEPDLCDHHRFGRPADTEQPAVPLLSRRQAGERHVSQTEAVL